MVCKTITKDPEMHFLGKTGPPPPYLFFSTWFNGFSFFVEVVHQGDAKLVSTYRCSIAVEVPCVSGDG